MPLANPLQDGPQARRPRAFWPHMIGPGVLLGLAVTGQAQPGPAILSALAVGGAVYWLSRRDRAADARPAPRAACRCRP